MTYTIYTDGSCLNNPGGPGGYAAVIFREGEMIEELSGGEAITTSNRMEITAAIVGLQAYGSRPSSRCTPTANTSSKP
jgi:ribonuclease HI